MKKRLPALLLALSLLTLPVRAADSMDHFVRATPYAGQFSDLTEASVFYDNVSALYEYGLSVGKSDGTFGLADPLTVGQAVIFAGRIRSLYRLGDAEAGPAGYAEPVSDSDAPPQPVYLPYLRYLRAEGVLGEELDKACAAGDTATRAQMAHVLARVLPEKALPPIHKELVTVAYASRRFITDVTEYTPYYQDILDLYRRGVAVGSDDTGSFLPDAPITRGAAAALLTRMVDPSLRLTPQWDLEDAYTARGATLADLVTPGAYLPSPRTEEELDQSVRYMLSTGAATLLLRYPELSAVDARQIMEGALTAVKRYCEQSYNSVSCTYSSAGLLTLTFSAAGAGERTAACRTASMEAAIAVHDQLWESGAITLDMSQRDRARVYYDWICANTVYDEGAAPDSLSHIPYNLFATGTAVCDGYTGAYNMLLKLEGIPCFSLSNRSHIWTVAMLDGQQVHIDTTWGDMGDHGDDAYFAMTPEEAYKAHPW